MTELWQTIESVLTKYSLVTAFACVGIIVWVSYGISRYITRGRMQGSAIAILIGLLLAWIGGVVTGGTKGIADIECVAGIGLMGGAMLRDLAIVATAFGVRLDEFLKTGISGIVSLLVGVLVSFLIGAIIAYAFGYRDAVSMTTIGGGAATYIVGPVTGTALGASSEVIALSVAAGLVKSMDTCDKSTWHFCGNALFWPGVMSGLALLFCCVLQKERRNAVSGRSSTK